MAYKSIEKPTARKFSVLFSSFTKIIRPFSLDGRHEMKMLL